MEQWKTMYVSVQFLCIFIVQEPREQCHLHWMVPPMSTLAISIIPVGLAQRPIYRVTLDLLMLTINTNHICHVLVS